MNSELTPQEAAQAAIDEYNEAYEQGGEIDCPMWALAVLREQEQAA